MTTFIFSPSGSLTRFGAGLIAMPGRSSIGFLLKRWLASWPKEGSGNRLACSTPISQGWLQRSTTLWQHWLSALRKLSLAPQFCRVKTGPSRSLSERLASWVCVASNCTAMFNVLRPMIIHSGREPGGQGYACDTRALCAAEKLAKTLNRFPDTTVIVPHLGADEFTAYEQLLDEFPQLYLDTTMMLGGYFPLAISDEFLERRSSRLLYGTDFPNIPY